MAFRLYHKPGSTVLKLDQITGVTLERLDVSRPRRAFSAPFGVRGFQRLSYGASYEVSVEITYALASNDLKDFHNRLQEWLDHADRGMAVGIARSSTYAGLWPLRDSGSTTFDTVDEGDTTLYAGTEATGYETSPVLAAGDLAVVESEPTESAVWPFRVSSWTAGTPKTVVAATAARVEMLNNGWLRHADFWPYLYRADEDLDVPAFALDYVTADAIRFKARFVQRLPVVS